MKKVFAIIAVCLMSVQFATAQDFDYDEPFYIQEQMPQFVGGDEAFAEWIEAHISYPLMADENFIHGRVVVTFVVEEDGFVGDIEVVEAADPLLADEVVERLQYMPQWIPAMQNGRCVKVKYTLPIQFVN